MASLDMNGPYDFDEETVKKVESAIGNYALGHMTKDNLFRPEYIGRSDSDLQDELLVRLKTHGHHKKFRYSYADSKEKAFTKECKNYHEFGPSENEIHPDSPDGTNLDCPFSQYH